VARCCLYACSAEMFCGLLGVLPLQLPDPRHRQYWSRPPPGIDLGLLRSPAQRVGVDAQFLADPPARRRHAPRVLHGLRNRLAGSALRHA